LKERRRERLEKLLLEQLASDILTIYELADRMVAVTRVRLSKDLSSAKVYITALEDVEEVVKILNSRTGYLRKLLATNLNLRYTPRLSFFKDEEEERAKRIDEIFRKLREEEGDSQET